MISLTLSRTIEEIVTEVEKFDALEQRMILSQIKAQRLQVEKKLPIAKYNSNTKFLSVSDIDAIKHQSRPRYTGK